MDRITDMLPPYYSLKGEWKIGNFAYRGPYTIYDANVCFEHHNEFNTPSHHFRKFMKHKELSRKNEPEYISYPYYAKPCELPKGAYIDISSAFKQIGSVIGIECHWNEGKHFAFGVSDFNSPLFNEKIMRGLIVSATGEKGEVTVWKSEQESLLSHKFKNTLYAPHLRLGVMRMLHAIAATLLPYCVYWHTDGLICPFHFIPKVEHILSLWGLESKVKLFGHTVVKARGVYKIGDTQTSSFQTYKRSSSMYINTQNPKWFLSQYQKGLSLKSDLIDVELL